MNSETRSQLLGFGQGLDLKFKRLIVLALDLQFGLEFFHKQLETRNLSTELAGIAACGTRGRGGMSLVLGSGRRRGTRSECFG